MKTFISGLLLALVCTGCVSQYGANSVSRQVQLRPDASALITMAEDGRFEDNLYSGSGRKTSLAVTAAFSRQLKRADMVEAPADLAQNLAQARAGNFDYLIVPVVVHWEDRATEWSGRSDRIEVELRALDAGSGQTLAIGSLTGKSKWATFGGDVPEDLLADPINQYVAWLFTPLDTPLPKPTAPTPTLPPSNRQH